VLVYVVYIIFILCIFFCICDAKTACDLKASDVVRQPKIADVSRGVTRDGHADSATRLRSSENAPDGLYTRDAADGDSVNVGIEWTGGDVRFPVIICAVNISTIAMQFV